MCDHDRHNSDFYVRTCFIDASAALSEIEKGRAIGGGLCLREACHQRLSQLGQFLLSHAGKVLFVWMLMVATFSVGLKSSQFTYSLEGLWLPDSGRIGDELSYTISYLGETDSWNNLMVIQMPPESNHAQEAGGSRRFKSINENEDDNILTRDALIAHLNIIKKASEVSVSLFDVDWKLKDLCHSASLPTSDTHYYINQIFENISPCNIITPLDCFWEGSKLLGPDYAVSIPQVGYRVKWTNLNPQKLLTQVKSYQSNFDFRILEDNLNKSGITTGYQYKPCLDPRDTECPETAPNFKSKQIPDIAALMTGGCYGYAKNYMHWPEQLILGGITKNETQHVRRAKAIQTVIQIMGNKDMYDYWADTFKVHHIGWNEEKAAQVLDAWQKRFAQEIKKLQVGYTYRIFPFSMATLNEALKQHTNVNIVKLAIVISLLMVYCMFMGQYNAVFGVVMLILNTVAGLGFCALLGVPLNILTIQVVPYLCVGLSLRDIWILVNGYKLTKDTKQSLKQCSPNIAAHNLYLAATFTACTLLPVPALKACAMQCVVLILSNTIAVLVVFPGILSIDERRKQAFNNRVKNYLNRQGNLYQPTTKRQNFTKTVSECCCEVEDEQKLSKKFGGKPADFLLNKIVKIFCLVCLIFGVPAGIYHGYLLKFSLQMPEFLPRNCSDNNYLKMHEKYFGFYSFSTVTTDISYPSSQYLIKDYHNSVANIKNVLGNESNSWLEIFQNYLVELQDEFEVNLENNCLNGEKWYKNATKKAILAYKLLANTGNINHPIEKSEILTKKLVSTGLIEEEPFYNYFSAWFSNDPVVSFMKNTFRPFPKHFSDSEEYDLKIPKTKALKYVETQFYVEKMHNIDDIIELIQEVRKTSYAFRDKGLKNYPKGLIFAFYDQFLDIFEYFAAIIGANFLACFICSFALLNSNTSLFLIAFKMILIIFLAIGYNLLNIDMNIVFIMTTSIAITILARNLMIIIEGFVTSIGNRDRRARLTIGMNLWPLFQGNLSFLLSIAVFYTSDFDFIRKYLFYTFVVTMLVDFCSTFMLFPIFLSLFGPKPMLIPLEHADRIATPSPVPSPVVTRKHYHHHNNNRSRRHNSHSGNYGGNSCGPGIPKQQTTREPSLTTITEESGCSITVQPEVVVQTTTYNNQNDSSTSQSNNSQHVTTKVTATANIKVEVHSRPNSRREDRTTAESSSNRVESTKIRTDTSSTSSSHRSERSCRNGSETSDSGECPNDDDSLNI